MTKNDIFLSQLENKITQLTEQMNSLNKTGLATPCFDVQLFHYQGPLLDGYAPYLIELNNNYQKLVHLVNLNSKEVDSDITPIIFLSELIVNQLTALQRELSTQSLRKSEKSVEAVQTLDEQYAKNLGYLNQLETMKYQLQQSKELSESEQNKKLNIIEERIVRCRHYLFTLEQRIENR